MKGVGKGIATGSKAIAYTGKEMGKGMVGKASTSTPLSLGKTGGAAGAIAQSGKVANQLGQFIGQTSGISDTLGAKMSQAGAGNQPTAGTMMAALSKMSGQAPSTQTSFGDQGQMQVGSPPIGNYQNAPVNPIANPFYTQGLLEEEIRRRQYANY